MLTKRVGSAKGQIIGRIAKIAGEWASNIKRQVVGVSGGQLVTICAEGKDRFDSVASVGQLATNMQR